VVLRLRALVVMGLMNLFVPETSDDKYLQNILKGRAQEHTIKLLLLGIGESGKSTLFKQLKILYGDYEMSDSEMEEVRSVIFSNIVDNMQILLAQCNEFGLSGELIHTDAWKMLRRAATIDEEIGAAITSLWSETKIQETWNRRSEFFVLDSAAYFFDNIARISAPDYMNKCSYSDQDKKQYQQDFLYARTQTKNVHVERLKINDIRFEFIDVGGQKSERRRWIPFFGHVTVVLFVVSLSDFDTAVPENPGINR